MRFDNIAQEKIVLSLLCCSQLIKKISQKLNKYDEQGL